MNKGAKYGRRGARGARREERAYRASVSDEQRSPARGPQRGTRVGVGAGCIGGQTGAHIHFRVLSLSFGLRIDHPAAATGGARLDANQPQFIVEVGRKPERVEDWCQ